MVTNSWVPPSPSCSCFLWQAPSYFLLTNKDVDQFPIDPENTLDVLVLPGYIV